VERKKLIQKGAWVCKVCNADEFTSYVDSIAHEARCANMEALALAASRQLD